MRSKPTAHLRPGVATAIIDFVIGWLQGEGPACDESKWQGYYTRKMRQLTVKRLIGSRGNQLCEETWYGKP
eukprot:9467584-Pyramimonas_sp.AAC.3